MPKVTRKKCFLVSWGGVRLSPFGTSATNWPIVPVPDDRRWTWSSRWNENWQGKPKYSEKTCPSVTFTTTNHIWPDLGSNPGRRGWKPATVWAMAWLASRVHFCSWFLQSIVEGEFNPQLTFIYEEAWFHLKGYINTQNSCYWSSQNPHLTHEVFLHPVKVGVWCAVSARRIVRPVFITKQLTAKCMYRSFSGNSF
jgi:hypothetical protein